MSSLLSFPKMCGNLSVSVPAFIALIFISLPLQARWYQVEVVVFENTATMSATQEKWPALSALLDLDNSVLLSSPEVNEKKLIQEETIEKDFGNATAFTKLDLEEMELSDIISSLESSDDYKTLLFSSWRQPGYGVKNPKRVYLSEVASKFRDEDIDPEIQELGMLVVEGLVGIKVSKLLHVELDFIYYHRGTPVRLKERRKVRLRETHYFDHPLFGLVVRISPYELETAGF